jgi:hypothetical protein
LGTIPAMLSTRIHGRRVALRTSFLAAALAFAPAGCAPSIDPAAKADIDRRVSSLQGQGASIAAPLAFVPMPLAAGQWSQYKMINNKGEPSFLTYKILGEEGGAYWFESVMDTYHGRTIQKMLLTLGNRTDPAQIEIRAVKTRMPDGTINEPPPGLVALMQNLYRKAVTMLVISWQGLPQEGTAVPAGRFDGCFKARSEVSWGPWSSVSDSWSHPAVPLSGLVRSHGVDKPFEMELVSFGLSGATSEM